MTPLWQPSTEQVAQSNLIQFMKRVGKSDYPALYQWSIDDIAAFWDAFWDFSGVIAHHKGERILIHPDSIKDARFFPDAQLNYAQNLLRRRDDDVALEFFGENQVHQTLTYGALYDQVARLAAVFQSWGIQPGDRIAAYLPNQPQTIIGLLAASAIGAVWSSCSPDFGVSGVIDRFGQIAPKVLMICDSYYYGGKAFDCLERLEPIRQALPSLERVIVVPYDNQETRLPPQTHAWTSLMATQTPSEIPFVMLPFDHPLYILYSSGTTGVPKCIVHRAGGALLQHMKEHQLHSDIRPNDVVFYFTTCGWMMWNWLVSALASQAKLVLYDGSPVYPTPTRLFDIADQVGVTLFGTSAKFIDNLHKLGVEPCKTNSLKSIRVIASTGSPLVPESFDYVYSSIKSDVCLASISGGTDIVSCFMLGNPIGAVYRGELQTAGLGLKVEVFDDQGRPCMGTKGELVCTKPFPCQPLGFWNDPDGQKYHQAYYGRFPNVWHHGDFVERTCHGGFIVYGRSDAVLNPGGVRIGTAEIYRQVEQINEVLESIVVGQDYQDDVRVVLFVKLRPHIQLDETLVQKIKLQIRTNTTPRHVPALVVQVADIPRTKNGKIAELAVREAIHHRPIKNVEALANPEILDLYRGLDLS